MRLVEHWNGHASRELIDIVRPADDMVEKADKETDYWAFGNAGRFRAENYVGGFVQATLALDSLRLPADVDSISLGSIFMHLSFANMEILFDRLLDSPSSSPTVVGGCTN
jgi:hypothetical protein